MIDGIRSRVLNELIRDASRPRKQLADELGISESYISKIIKELQLDGTIEKFTAHINYDHMGYNNSAFSLVKLKDITREQLHTVATNISNIEGAIEVYTTFGHSDIYIRWLCKSPEEIMTNIENVIDTKHIEDIETVNLGRKYKKNFGPILKTEKGDR
jgi:DNA-binding Lrp family transcriptional regulator